MIKAMIKNISPEIFRKTDCATLAEKSGIITESCIRLMGYLEKLPDHLKKEIQKLLYDPFPDFIIEKAPSGAESVLERGKKLPDRERLFKAAPGAAADSHNNFPGGLVIHTLTNIELAWNNINSLEQIYPGVSVDREKITAALFMHDMMKAWIMTWKEDHTSHQDISVEGHKLHHLLIAAQAISDRLDSDLIRMIVSVHYDPVKERSRINDALSIACSFVNTDRPDWDDSFTMEEWICYSAEHQTRNLLLYCSSFLRKELECSIKKSFGGNADACSVKAAVNAILAFETDVALYSFLLSEGRESFDIKIHDALEVIAGMLS